MSTEYSFKSKWQPADFMDNKPKIMISGANGFVGASLKDHLHSKGMQVSGLTRANCDYSPATIAALISQERPDYFLHAAGNASVKNSYQNPDTAVDSSVALTQQVLEGIRISGAPVRFIGLSTAAVYGIPEVLPISETAPLRPISPYGVHKLRCEQLVDEFAPFLKKPPVIARIFSLFGEAQKKLILYELFNQFSNTDKVIIRGTGQETRDFLSIDVFCQKLHGLMLAMHDHTTSLKINVAAGESHSILESAQLMKRLLESKKAIHCKGEVMEGNPPNWEADTTLYNQVVKTRILFDFEQELSKTLTQWSMQRNV